MLVAGTETPSATVSWCLYLLSRHPDAQELMAGELRETLGGRLPGTADFPALDYTHRVLTETLRLFPPVWLFSRRAMEDVVVDGRHLKAGTTLLLSPYTLHRDPAVFPRPEEFDPDRWLPSRAGGVPRGAYIPFGIGARMCVGDRFGLAEATVMLAAAVGRYRFHPVNEISIAPTLSLVPAGLRLRLEARKETGSGPHSS